MGDIQNLYLAFSVIVIISEPFGLDMRNFV
jgi:hypothetical protein